MKFEIWKEGYLVSGMEGIPASATFLGTYSAENFRNACIIWDSIHNRDKGYGDFNAQGLSVWGCRLFDNEADARASFG